MSEPNLYDAGYEDGFKDGFKEAQGRVLDNVGDDPEIMAATRAEWAARAKAAEAKLERASKMLPRGLSAIYKDRKQEAIDVLEAAIAELTGGEK